MDMLDAMVKDPRFQHTTNFQPGDLQFSNNHVALHARTAFEDYPEPERRRHLLRLWLSMPNTRAHSGDSSNRPCLKVAALIHS